MYLYLWLYVQKKCRKLQFLLFFCINRMDYNKRLLYKLKSGSEGVSTEKYLKITQKITNKKKFILCSMLYHKYAICSYWYRIYIWIYKKNKNNLQKASLCTAGNSCQLILCYIDIETHTCTSRTWNVFVPLSLVNAPNTHTHTYIWHCYFLIKLRVGICIILCRWQFICNKIFMCRMNVWMIYLSSLITTRRS